jgi:hypothetical protein
VLRTKVDLRTEDHAPRLGGTYTNLHRSSPFKRPWKIMKNGDLWEALAKAIKAKGPTAS